MKTITQTIVKRHKEKTTVILCDKCKENGVETALKETGLPNVDVAERHKATLFVTFMVAEGDICEVQDSDAFSKEFEGDWCQPCVRKKLREFLADDSSGRGPQKGQR